jgi:lysophospholipase L1-like esterase
MHSSLGSEEKRERAIPLVAPPADRPAGPPARPAGAAPAEATPRKAVTPEVHAGTEKRHEQFNAISKAGKAKLVFLGDSITEGWDHAGRASWVKHFEKRNAANFGISGDCTEHVLWRLDHGNFDGLSPALIVVMIGTNNTRQRKDPAADTAAGVQAILDRLKAKCPDSKILLLAIFPRGETPDDEMRVINDAVNTLIEKMVDGKKIVYKDIGKEFLDEKGRMQLDLMPDLRHPSEMGYEVWANAIERDVATMLGEDKKDNEAAKPATGSEGKKMEKK